MDLGNGVEINFEKLTDARLQAVRTEVEAAGAERGLWAPEGVGQLAVVQAVEAPEDLRDQILATAEVEIEHTNRVFEVINGGRRKNKRFDIVPAGEQRERLEDQLTDRALEAAGHLYTDEGRPLIPVPPLPDAISAEELVTAIDKSSKHGICGWAGRLPFLAKFPINSLTGFDEQRAESGALTLVETAYDASREGTRDQQLANLQTVQKEFPEVGTASILATASLAQRYNGQPNSWLDTYTRAIEVDPQPLDDFDYVVSASVRDAGRSRLGGSHVQVEGASRRQVGLEA